MDESEFLSPSRYRTRQKLCFAYDVKLENWNVRFAALMNGHCVKFSISSFFVFLSDSPDAIGLKFKLFNRKNWSLSSFFDSQWAFSHLWSSVNTNHFLSECLAFVWPYLGPYHRQNLLRKFKFVLTILF